MEDTELRLDSIPRRSQHLRWRREVDTVALYDTKSRDLSSLNHVAAAIWEKLDGASAVREVASQIAEEFDAPIDQVLRDTLDFLGKLKVSGYIAEAPDDAE